MISIYPRYSRRNRRYKIKTPKKKVPAETKIIRQSIASFFILGIFIISSFFVSKESIGKYLVDTLPPEKWYLLLDGFIDKAGNKASKTVSSYLDFVGAASEKFNNKKPKIEKIANAKQDTDNSEEKAPPANVVAEEAQWCIPAEGSITSRFGDRIHPVNGENALHTGIDIGANEGDTVVCAYPGYVKVTGFDNANGNYVVAEHDGGITTVYAHLKSVSVTKGEYVSPKIKIGEVGSTGISTGPHLHFEIKVGDKSVNPEDFVSFEER